MKLKKYKWKIREVEFLGVVIGLERIKMENERIKMILDQLTLNRVKNVQKFLGLANYYRQFKFIKDFASIAGPLYNLVKKESEVELDREIEESIQRVEVKVYKRMLAAPDLDKKNENKSQYIRLYNT